MSTIYLEMYRNQDRLMNGYKDEQMNKDVIKMFSKMVESSIRYLGVHCKILVTWQYIGNL